MEGRRKEGGGVKHHTHRTPAAKWGKGDEVNLRTRAEPQWIVRQAHSHTYGTPVPTKSSTEDSERKAVG